MANEEHLAILKQGVEAWNAWRREHPQILPDLRGARLEGAKLWRPDLDGLNLSFACLDCAGLADAHLDIANLVNANLTCAKLDGARLLGANLDGAKLFLTHLDEADLSDARLEDVDLIGANLDGANLTAARLTRAGLLGTVFANVDLSSCEGLETCRHLGPSIIDHRTLQRSGPLPLAFLRGVGLPDRLINPAKPSARPIPGRRGIAQPQKRRRRRFCRGHSGKLSSCPRLEGGRILLQRGARSAVGTLAT